MGRRLLRLDSDFLSIGGWWDGNSKYACVRMDLVLESPALIDSGASMGFGDHYWNVSVSNGTMLLKVSAEAVVPFTY